MGYSVLALLSGEERGGGQPDPWIRGWPGLQKFFFRPFGHQFSLNIRGAGPPGPFLGSAAEVYDLTSVKNSN